MPVCAGMTYTGDSLDIATTPEKDWGVWIWILYIGITVLIMWRQI
jgi:hypothetical protein